MGLGLPPQARASTAGLAEPVVQGLLVLGGDRLIGQEEAAAVEVEGDGRAEVVLVLVAVREDVADTSRPSTVQSVQGLDCATDVEVADAEVTQAAETGGDVERDVLIAAAAREPGPQAVARTASG